MKLQKLNEDLKRFTSKYPLVSLIIFVFLVGMAHVILARFFTEVEVKIVDKEVLIETIVEVPLEIQTVVVDRAVIIEQPKVIEKIIIQTVEVPRINREEIIE